MNTLSKNYWAAFAKKSNAVQPYGFEVLRDYLPKNKNFRALEVGCCPGRQLAALHKEFGYRICGVDTQPPERTIAFLEQNGIRSYTIAKESFLDFYPTFLYDVVCSFGYLEHFDNPLEHLKKMAVLTRPGGYVVIGIPNYRYLQYYLHYVTDEDKAVNHNLELMSTSFLEWHMNELGFQTIYNGYYLPFGYWVLSQKKWRRALSAPLVGLSILTKELMGAYGIHWQFGANPLTSPYLFYIGRKAPCEESERAFNQSVILGDVMEVKP